MVRLQGKLSLVVKEAENLPNLDYSRRHSDDASDPYVKIYVVGNKGKKSKIGKTQTVKNNLNPKWNYNIETKIDQDITEILFKVMDKDMLKDDTIGTCAIAVHTFNNSMGYNGRVPLLGKKGAEAGNLSVTVKFSGAETADEKVIRREYHSMKIQGCVRRKTSEKSKSSTPLHGKLSITVERAYNLPNLDTTLLNSKNKSDPFATVSLVDSEGNEWKVATTKHVDDDLNPVWNETFSLNVCHDVSSVLFQVYDQDFMSSEKIGSAEVSVSEILKTKGKNEKYQLRQDGKNSGELVVGISLKEHELSDDKVPDCPFKERSGNAVTIFQDARCCSLPVQVLDNYGRPYESSCAWDTILESIEKAERLIFITGWSVKASIALVRDDNGDGVELGRLLWNKALEGVDVRLLLWDEITSNESMMQQGAMSTFDNETKEYFKNSPVKVGLALRKKKTKGVIGDSSFFTKLCYSHHQKTIIVDAPDGDGNHLVAFIGGLDLTAGRFDRPDHPLFSTLSTLHKADFYNNCIKTNVHSGPRQPWHDIHGKVVGPAAVHILRNFTSRWNKQGFEHGHTPDLALVNKDYKYEGKDSWNVQVFRSISEDSLRLEKVSSHNLMAKKGRKIDNSLQRAYIHQIQRTERFIYIENQYFLGSSHVWENCRDITVKNLIPLEIALKICQKIEKKEHFVAYILIPMFPEGNPADKVVQEILHWQFHTIEMMYSRIGDAIHRTGLDTHPQDYLLFFCLGKRETPDDVPDNLKQPLDETASLAFKNKRHMIYVHSKMAIFDDRYIIVGSANINDRSLTGTRDTEIAIGAYQPDPNSPGTVSCFRKCLWAEHWGAEAPVDLDPASIQCARRVRQLSEESLQRYIDLTKPLPEGHMLLYPLHVEKNGEVRSRSDCETFPDTNAKVVGMRSMVIPSELTT